MLVYQRVFIVVSGILLRDLSGAGLFGVGCEERPWPRSVAWGMAQIPRERSVCSVLCWFQKAHIVPAICDWLMQSSTYSTPMYLLRGATGHSPVWTPFPMKALGTVPGFLDQAVWNLEDLIVHQDGHPLDRMGPQPAEGHINPIWWLPSPFSKRSRYPIYWDGSQWSQALFD